MEDEKLRRRRMHCKINQRHYRQRKKKQQLADQQLCETLRQKNYQLELCNTLLKEQYYLTTHRTEFHVHKIQNYLACFQFGMNMESKATQHQQLQCLRATMDQDLILGDQVGALALEKQWVGYAVLFPKFEMTVQSFNVVGEGDAIHANCNLKLQFTEEAVRVLFPTILPTPKLLKSIIGSDFNFHTRLMFYFGDNGKVQDLGVDVNFLTGLVSQLGLSGAELATYNRSKDGLLPAEVLEEEHTPILQKCAEL